MLLPGVGCRDYFESPLQERRTYGKEQITRLRLPKLLLSAPANGAGGSLSEARVKRGERIVHGDKELIEKLGRNDPCPCGSPRKFQAVLHAHR
jgi:hypothetical protein